MNFFLFHIWTIYTYRLLKLKLKEKEDLFLTNSKGILKLKPPSKYNIHNQTVLVHKRRLLFIKDTQLYKMFLNPGSLEIKLKKDVVQKRQVGFLRGGGKRRKVDPFGFATKRGKNSKKVGVNLKVGSKGESIELESKVERPPYSRVERPPFGKVERPPNLFTNPHPPSIKDQPDAKQLEILKNLLSTLERGDDAKEDPKEVQEELREVQNDAKDNIKEDYFIESDSKIDEDTVKYQEVDVYVSSLDKKYFKLKTSGNNCVTFMHRIFIFTPCINIDNQLFTLVKEEEIKKKVKRKRSRAYEEEDSTGDKVEDRGDSIEDDSTGDSTEDRGDGSYIPHRKVRVVERPPVVEKVPKDEGLLSYNRKVQSTLRECPTRTSPEYLSVCYGTFYNKEKCESIKKRVEECEKKGENKSTFRFIAPINRNNNSRVVVPPTNRVVVPTYPPTQHPTTTYPTTTYPTTQHPNTTIPTHPNTTTTTQPKKDFNPDELIHKLKESIKASDFGEII